MAYVIVALGIGLRLWAFLRRPSVALDEARLAINVAARTWAQLAAPLDHDQSAPLLFLWMERLAVRLFGANEWALRVVPLAAGIGLLVLMYPLTRRLLRGPSALLGTAIIAVAPAMIAYSNEAKQYMLEALVAAILLGLAIELTLGRTPDRVPVRGALLRLGAVGAVSVWMSASAVLVLASIVCALLVDARAMRTGRSAIGVLALVWTLSFGVAYTLVYRSAAGSQYMARFWAPAFLSPDGDVLWRAWLAVAELIWGFMAGHSGVPRTPEVNLYVAGCAMTAAVSAVVGARYLWRRSGPPTVVLLVGPVLFAIVASAVHRYPVGQRLLLFTVPSLLTLGLAGLEAAIGRVGTRWRQPAWLLVDGIFISPLLAVAVLQSTVFDAGSRARQVVAELQARRKAGEAVYVFGRTLPAWEFYSTDWSAPNTGRVDFMNRVARSGGPAFENAPSRRRPLSAGEGSDLVYHGAEGDELIGLPTGMEYVAARGLLQRTPDAGWVGREADRIAQAARPGVWMLMTEFFGPEYGLIEELRQRGMKMTYGRIEPGHILVRWEAAS